MSKIEVQPKGHIRDFSRNYLISPPHTLSSHMPKQLRNTSTHILAVTCTNTLGDTLSHISCNKIIHNMAYEIRVLSETPTYREGIDMTHPFYSSEGWSRSIFDFRGYTPKKGLQQRLSMLQVHF